MGYDFGIMLPRANNLSTSDHTSVISITFFVTLLCGCIVVGHLLEENRWMNESITTLVIVSISVFFWRTLVIWVVFIFVCFAFFKYLS